MRSAVLSSKVLAGVAVAVAAVLAAVALNRVVAGEEGGVGSAPGVMVAEPNYAFDPRDDRALAAYATDMFVGRVVAQTGSVGAPTSVPGQEVPQAQYAVEVIQVVKGTAAGTVTVNQIGGPDPMTGTVLLIEGDSLLRPGETQLFVVRFVPERGWYQIVVARYGHLRAANQAQRAALVERFARAADVPVPSPNRPHTPTSRSSAGN